MAFTLKVNGTAHSVDVDADTPLLWVLRDVLGTTGTKFGAIGTTSQSRALQQAWLDLDVVQCGYCQSGQIMSAVALLKSIPKPTDTEIEESMGGNLCRCATYLRIREAIKSASQQLKR